MTDRVKRWLLIISLTILILLVMIGSFFECVDELCWFWNWISGYVRG